MPKLLWRDSTQNVQISRLHTSYEVFTNNNGVNHRVEISREEFRQLFLVMKKELGLAGD